jgi:polyhydroxyalkanoate synthase
MAESSAMPRTGSGGAAIEEAVQAAGALAPEGPGPLFTDPDPVLIGRALTTLLGTVARRPLTAASLTAKLGDRLLRTGTGSLRRLVGRDTDGPMPVDAKDKRFADPAWTDNPGFWALRQAYLAVRQYGLDLLLRADLDRRRNAKAQVAWGFLTDALAPTNFPVTNPAVLKRALETGGRSLFDGGRNFVDDVLHNGFRPRQVDTSPFELGRNLACTPAKVVHRSDLVEILQYLPQTGRVHTTPLLCSPPWINKYYVMDLAPERSFIEWAVRHERTVFAISYRNPDASMAGTTMDDYLVEGPCAALDVISDITGADKIDLVGLCLGGTLTMITAAYLNAVGDHRINTISLLNTMIDYSEPGALGAFTDPESVAKLERKIGRRGYLDGAEMGGTFDVLRPNDLIFNYVVSNWLMGKQPPAFDILAWNNDATRMPAAMYSYYLRNFYVHNTFANRGLRVRGRVLDLQDVYQDLYVVAAINDHIVPWTSSYRTISQVAGKPRFVLSSGGHIAGIVNPPSAKAWYERGDEHPDDPAQWHTGAQRRSGSWWEDWTRWGAQRAGPLVEPPQLGSPAHPVLADGPGDYVRG